MKMPLSDLDAKIEYLVLYKGMNYESYMWATSVDKETADLIAQSLADEQIDKSEAERLWWNIVGQAQDRSSNSDSVQ